MQIDFSNITSVFPTEQALIDRIEKITWGKKPICPYCNDTKSLFSDARYYCKSCNTYFNVKIGSLFQGTRISLRKWLFAVAILNEKDISSREMAKCLGVTKDTAWLMMTKIRSAHENDRKLLKLLLIDLL